MELEDIYKIIDKSDYNLNIKYENRIIPLFKEFGNIKYANGELKVSHYAQLEIDIQQFFLSDNKLNPTLTGTTNNGEYYEYPSIKEWTDDDFNYLISRQDTTNNPYLKAKYSHILWLSPKKHLKYAYEALNQYVSIINVQNFQVWGNNEINDVWDLKKNLTNAFYLAVSTHKGVEVDRIKQIIIQIVQNFRFESSNVFLNINLIQFMLNNSKAFPSITFKGLDDICFEYAMQQTSQYTRIDILKIADKVAIRQAKKTFRFKEQIAIAYEELCYLREDETKFVSIKFCLEAINYFKKIKDLTKVQELQSRYKYLKQNMKFARIEQECDITDTIKGIKDITETILNKSPEDILLTLMYSPNIIPSYDLLYEHASHVENNSFGHSIHDDFGHVSAYYSNKEEIIHFSINQEFTFSLELYSMQIIRDVIIGGVAQNKLTPFSVLNFLKKTWIGEDITITYKQDIKNKYNWLHAIAPGINDFFSQLVFFNLDHRNIPNFILAIDSLTLKFEGIIRDICELRGVNTFFEIEDGKKRTIVKEKDINALLREDVIKEILSKDDLLLLQFLLIDKSGWNLRNKVAHSLIKSRNEYDIQYILLLFVGILRISKYEYAPIKPPSQEK